MEIDMNMIVTEKFIRERYNVETSSEVFVGGISLVRLLSEYSSQIAIEFTTYCLKLDRDILYTHTKEKLFEMFLHDEK